MSGRTHTANRGIRFSAKELQDLAVAWLALGVAFMFFLNGDLATGLLAGDFPVAEAARSFGLSLATVGVGFLLHELAHKVVAIRFGQLAEFRADYSMLALAIAAGLAGFLFAAPGAVYHGGRPITKRQNGLIALAGPLTNVALVAVFLPFVFLFDGLLGTVGVLGVGINALLAGFNMIPFGPLDGRKVLTWSKPVFAGSFLLCGGLAAAVFVVLFG
ncbi:metalloprotease [Halomarina rubra]|uniref:Metalloprotease n=1 Tax=Halomarina rubra TaxID=2071873 RepID=A0ABD6B0K0_9EURY|nr:metalloprotease [Halomarina rubra]